jgi:hypothetical protein
MDSNTIAPHHDEKFATTRNLTIEQTIVLAVCRYSVAELAGNLMLDVK